MSDEQAPDLTERLERLERVLGLQTLASDEISVRNIAGDGHSTQSINCNSVRSCVSVGCVAEDVAARRF